MKKTITVATKGDSRRLIAKHRLGWNLPPEEGPGAFVGGTGAFAEAVDRWKGAGWKISREPNPNFKPRPFFAL
ncbi:hypothetical protein RCKAI_32 [Rhodobacter phage RcKai]|nr:hypothetical protein RCKAI_32 [Rhodobacter phage RcKai]